MADHASDAFPTPSHDDWSRAAEKALRGKPLDSISWRSESGVGLPPLVESTRAVAVPASRHGISIAVSEFGFAPSNEFADAIRESLANGADLVHVQSSHATLAHTYGHVPGERMLISYWAASEQPDHWFRAAVAGDVNGVIGHDADSSQTPVTQIAEILLGTLDLLDEVVTEADLPPEHAAPVLVLPVSVGPDVVTEVAKLRALRANWHRLARHVGLAREDADAVRILATPSEYRLSRFEPETNLLRCTLSAFAAIAGGADIVEIEAYDAQIGGGSFEDSARVAMNQLRILLQESHLGAVSDPFAGAPMVEAMTAALAKRSWTAMEKLDTQIDDDSEGRPDLSTAARATALRRFDSVARRERIIVGINRFAEPSRDDQLDEYASFYGRSENEIADYAAVREGGLLDAAQPFEWLRDRVLSHVLRNGRRPLALIVGAGDLPAMRADYGYAADLFRCGGFEIEEGGPGTTPADAATALRGRVFDALVVCGDDSVVAAVEAATDMPYYRIGADGTDSKRLIAWAYEGVDAVELLGDALDRIGVERIR